MILDSIPRNASSTMRGNNLVKPMIKQVPYPSQLGDKLIPKETITEFKLSKKDQERTYGIGIHSINYVKQNKELAKKIN